MKVIGLKAMWIAALLAAVACTDNSFSGKISKGGGDVRGKNSTTPKYEDSGNTPSQGEPGDDDLSVNPPTKDIPNVIDIIGDLFDKGKDLIVTTDLKDVPNADIVFTDDSLVFGKDEIFHIGDNAFEASTCQLGVEGLRANPVQGKLYSFNFEVLSEIDANIDINYLCGLDYDDRKEFYGLLTNFSYLVTGQSELDKRALPAGASGTDLSHGVHLTPGTYSIVVISNENPNNRNDRDDYMVGRVKIAPLNLDGRNPQDVLKPLGVRFE